MFDERRCDKETRQYTRNLTDESLYDNWGNQPFSIELTQQVGLTHWTHHLEDKMNRAIKKTKVKEDDSLLRAASAAALVVASILATLILI